MSQRGVDEEAQMDDNGLCRKERMKPKCRDGFTAASALELIMKLDDWKRKNMVATEIS